MSKILSTILKGIIEFFKKDAVLTISWILAVASACFIPPDAGYGTYIDWNTLALLFSLMCVVAGLRSLGLFSRMGAALLRHVKKSRQLVFCLWLYASFRLWP